MNSKPLTDPRKRLDFDLRASYLEADDTGLIRAQKQGKRLGRPKGARDKTIRKLRRRFVID